MPDAPSLPALRRGDADAWRALFETYAEPLYLYAYHRCGADAALAEDVRQETFLAAIQGIQSYRGEEGGALFGWLCGIARHKAADLARRRRREEPELPSGEDEDAPEPPDPAAPLPEQAAVRAETRAAVVRALWSLPADYRAALISRYARCEPVDRLAARLDRSYKAVESLLSRARLALREKLKEEDDGRD